MATSVSSRARRFDEMDSSSESLQPSAKRSRTSDNTFVTRSHSTLPLSPTNSSQTLAHEVSMMEAVSTTSSMMPPPPDRLRSRMRPESLVVRAVREAQELAQRVEPQRRLGRARPNTLSMYNFTLQVVRRSAKNLSDSVRTARIMETWEYAKLGQAAQVECTGDLKVRLMQEARECIAQHGFPPSPQQRVMFKAWLSVSYSQFYGDQIQQHLVRLLKENGWSELRAEMIVLAPRRFGKTIEISADSACEIVVLPEGHDVLVYSNNGRASKMLLLQSYKFVKILSGDPRFGGKLVSLNKSESMQYQTRWGTINDFFAYPAKPENLRGTGSKKKTGTVVAEEFAYMNLKVVYEIVAPTLTRENVKFIGITTVSDADSFVTPLADAKFPDGRSVILTLNFELVCEDCKAAGIPEKCKCLMADIPHWQSSTQHKKIEIIMKDHIDTYLKELKGFQADASVTPAFNPKAVKFLASKESIIMNRQTLSREIFVAVDPACGGDHSKFAIVSAIYTSHVMVIVGIESFSVGGGLHAPTHQHNLLLQHFDALRKIPGLEGARIILVPESNYAWESQRYALDIIDKRVPNVYLMDEDEKQQGVRTSNPGKKMMAVLFNRALNAHAIKFHPLMVSLSGKSKQSEREELIKQIGLYRRKKIQKKGDSSEYDKPTEIYTGKIGGNADDLAVMAQLNYVSHNIYFAKYEEKYKNQRALCPDAEMPSSYLKEN